MYSGGKGYFQTFITKLGLFGSDGEDPDSPLLSGEQTG
jgi:hypothetical protein